jgi:hypothetical protein
MTVQPSDLYDVLRRLRYDLTSAQAKVTDALNILTALNLADSPAERCHVCGLEFRGPQTLAEHIYVSHDGAEPAHWLAAEALAGIDLAGVRERDETP